jgi:hypothetical protein
MSQPTQSANNPKTPKPLHPKRENVTTINQQVWWSTFEVRERCIYDASAGDPARWVMGLLERGFRAVICQNLL